MKVLVTGAGGFLGPRIVDSLLAQGCDDLRLQFRQPGRERVLQNLRERYPNVRVEAVTANLLARDGAASMVSDVDCVIHAAAGTKGAAADMFLNSVVGSRNLLDACVGKPIKVVLVSSFSVYDTEHLPQGAVLNEQAPTEVTGVTKGAYGFAKTQQEQLVRRYAGEGGLAAPVVLRPGVIYGPGGGAFSARVGISAMGRFIRLGNRGLLPLTYVENCADAIARAALAAPAGAVYNVVDDDLPSCGEFLRQYRRQVSPIKVLPVPYPVFLLGARWLSAYNRKSKGQLPDLFSPHVVKSMYRPLKYSNAALKAIGWTQRVPTAEGMQRHFAALKAEEATRA